MAESKEKLKNLLIRVKEKSEKTDLNPTFKKRRSSHHFMENREKMEAVADFIFLGSKITVDSDYSHEIKRCLLLGRKSVTNLDRVFKS